MTSPDPVVPHGEQREPRPGGWVDGIGWVARRRDLPTRLLYRWTPDTPPRPALAASAANQDFGLCVVAEWPDGSEPRPPTPQPEAPADVESLRSWKDSAMQILSEWERVWVALGRPGPLGGSKAANALAEVERRDALAALPPVPGAGQDEWGCTAADIYGVPPCDLQRPHSMCWDAAAAKATR